MEQDVGTWDSVLLENLSEDSFINNIHQRYKRDNIYTYIGTSVIAVNPYRHISEHTSEIIRAYGSKGIFQLPPHIYGLANLAYQSLKDQSEDQCIILLGESGAGKTESFKRVVNYLTHIQDIQRKRNKCQLGAQSRRASTSYSGTVTPCPSSRISTPKKQQSQTTCHLSSATKVRAESSDRSSRKNTREKVVDFDFSHHKSTDNISDVPIQRHERLSMISTALPTKSCFKHNVNDTAMGRNKNIGVGDKTVCDASTNVSMEQFAQNSNCEGHSQSLKAPTTYNLFATAGCRQCGHSRCTRQRSFEIDDQECRKGSSTAYKLKGDVRLRGSCSNLVRQHSSENAPCNRELNRNTAITSSRMSLFDTYKLNLLYTEGLKANRDGASGSCAMQNQNSRMRECVSYVDVFLEAMGNATTMQNSNSSRYGKFLDVEIDYKGDPVGVHITHYSNNEFKRRRKKLSYILPIAVGS